MLSESVWGCCVWGSLLEPESIGAEVTLVHGGRAFFTLNLKVNRTSSGRLAPGALPVHFVIQIENVTATDAWLQSVQFVI